MAYQRTNSTNSRSPLQSGIFIFFLALSTLQLGGCGGGPLIYALDRFFSEDLEPDPPRPNPMWVDRQAGAGYFNSLAPDQRGRIHISYYDSAAQNLKYARSGFGDKWDIELVDEDGSLGMHSSLAIASENRPHIAYFDAGNRRLKYAYFNGETWDIQIVSDLGGRFASLALDKDDVAHIAFVTEEDDLAYVRWDSSKELQDAPQILETGILNDSVGGKAISHGISIGIWQGYPVVAYSHAPSGAVKVQAFMYPDEKGWMSGWTEWVVEGGEQGSDVGEQVSMLVEDGKALHLSYFDRVAQKLKYARWKQEERRWVTESMPSEGTVSEWSTIMRSCQWAPDITAQSCSTYIGYYDVTDERLKAAKRGDVGGHWETFSADKAESHANGTHTSMALLWPGQIGIAYHDNISNGLKFLLFHDQ